MGKKNSLRKKILTTTGLDKASARFRDELILPRKTKRKSIKYCDGIRICLNKSEQIIADGENIPFPSFVLEVAVSESDQVISEEIYYMLSGKTGLVSSLTCANHRCKIQAKLIENVFINWIQYEFIQMIFNFVYINSSNTSFMIEKVAFQ